MLSSMKSSGVPRNQAIVARPRCQSIIFSAGDSKDAIHLVPGKASVTKRFDDLVLKV